MLFLQAINVDSNKCIYATTHIQKLRGLYFRHKQGCIILIKCKSIHTMFFCKNLDVAFLSADFVVLKSIRDLKPWKFVSCKNSWAVIERFADQASNWLKEGDKIEVKEVKHESLSSM